MLLIVFPSLALGWRNISRVFDFCVISCFLASFTSMLSLVRSYTTTTNRSSSDIASSLTSVDMPWNSLHTSVTSGKTLLQVLQAVNSSSESVLASTTTSVLTVRMVTFLLPFCTAYATCRSRQLSASPCEQVAFRGRTESFTSMCRIHFLVV